MYIHYCLPASPLHRFLIRTVCQPFRSVTGFSLFKTPIVRGRALAQPDFAGGGRRGADCIITGCVRAQAETPLGGANVGMGALQVLDLLFFGENDHISS